MTMEVSAIARRGSLMMAVMMCVAAVANAQSVPAPWTAADIGGPVLSGSASHNAGVFTITGAGSDVWGAADQFLFVYQRITGDAEVIARVDDLDGASAYAKAGVMIRKSLSANAAHAFSHVTVGAGVRAVRRLTDGGTSRVNAGGSVAAPVWLRATRKGTQVTTAWSSNGTTWATVATDTISFGTSVYVGIAVNGRSSASRATAVLSRVTVTGGASTAGSLPAGQQKTDIGAPAIAGTSQYASGTYTIKAGGADIWDVADQFHFVYQPISGNVEIVSRVASITRAHDWSKAGVMVRESLTAPSRHAAVFTSAAKGYAFQRRPETGAYSVHTSGGSGSAAGWVRLVRTGDLFEAYRSADGVGWTKIGSDTIAMGATVYVGLAVTSHNTASATTALLSNVRITAAAAVNQNPAVSLTTPGHGASYTAPATVSLAANASDPENRLASVDFYAGSTLIGRDTTPPYSASWPVSAAGTYALSAVAHDADGGSSTSAAVTVTIAAASSGAPRAVAFAPSATHSTNVSSYLLRIYAAGANPATAAPLASSDLGRPTPDATNTITVDRAAFFSALAAGSYLATVTAIGPGGQAPSAAVAFTR